MLPTLFRVPQKTLEYVIFNIGVLREWNFQQQHLILKHTGTLRLSGRSTVCSRIPSCDLYNGLSESGPSGPSANNSARTRISHHGRCQHCQHHQQLQEASRARRGHTECVYRMSQETSQGRLLDRALVKQIARLIISTTVRRPVPLRQMLCPEERRVCLRNPRPTIQGEHADRDRTVTSSDAA